MPDKITDGEIPTGTRTIPASRVKLNFGVLFPVTPPLPMEKPILLFQEIPYDDPDSRYMFQPTHEKPFVATPAAIAIYRDSIYRCLTQLQELAVEKNGLDYLQVFEDPDRPESLWFMEDDEGGAITALLPSDH